MVLVFRFPLSFELSELLESSESLELLEELLEEPFDLLRGCAAMPSLVEGGEGDLEIGGDLDGERELECDPDLDLVEDLPLVLDWGSLGRLGRLDEP